MQKFDPLWLSATLLAIVLEKSAAQQNTHTGRGRPKVTRCQDFADLKYGNDKRGTYRQT